MDKNIIFDYLYDKDNNKFIPENDDSGNIEYKLVLNKKTTKKKDNMIAQLLWRMNEGNDQYGVYEANYIIGVYDDGKFSEIREKELNNSINILKSVVKKANSKIIKINRYIFPENKLVAHIIIRKDNKNKNIPEYNFVLLGPTDVGKSTIMSRLTYGQKDNGDGFSRKLILRHVHEKISGNTSCCKYDTIGFEGSKYHHLLLSTIYIGYFFQVR